MFLLAPSPLTNVLIACGGDVCENICYCPSSQFFFLARSDPLESFSLHTLNKTPHIAVVWFHMYDACLLSILQFVLMSFRPVYLTCVKHARCSAFMFSKGRCHNVGTSTCRIPFVYNITHMVDSWQQCTIVLNMLPSFSNSHFAKYRRFAFMSPQHAIAIQRTILDQCSTFPFVYFAWLCGRACHCVLWIDDWSKLISCANQQTPPTFSRCSTSAPPTNKDTINICGVNTVDVAVRYGVMSSLCSIFAQDLLSKKLVL